MKHILITTALLLAAASTQAQDTLAFPNSPILDLPDHLTAEQESSIQTVISDLDQKVGGKAFLVIIDSLPANVGILDYTKGIFKKWDLNNYGNGLNYIIIYSRKNHAVRIEGSDKVIELVTRPYLQSVTTNSMMPYFRKRMDYDALKRGMEMIALKIENN